MIHLFVSSDFRSSSSALTLHQQVVPDFIIDRLLESNVTSILGDDGALRGQRQRLLWPRHPIVFSWGAVTPPQSPGLLLTHGRWACPSSIPSTALLRVPPRSDTPELT